LRELRPVTPFVEKTIQNGMSYGLSVAGYDVRIKEHLYLDGLDFNLASTIEYFKMPKDVIGLVKNKSTWARRGLSVYETVIEPGWEGYLTIEMVNHSENMLNIKSGDPIAQILFMRVDQDTSGYSGKYQCQSAGPQEAIFEH
jgi:dCTP deaminase